MEYSNHFIRFNWVVLIFIYFVVFAGSFVRISGSGMGCPDWPKCFGKWVPPIEITDLPADYREAYLLKREKKVQKFCNFLNAIGMGETASKIKSNPDVLKEEAFNVRKTWTEYINRLLGFIAGNLMIIGLIWFFVVYKNSMLKWLMLTNLVLMGVEGWFGSIVVATNLVPWTITIHLFLALVIILVQIFILYKINSRNTISISFSNMTHWFIWIIFVVTFYQMFLGTQVREETDYLIKEGVKRSDLINRIGLPFLIHRSFSWLVLLMMVFIAWVNEKENKYKLIRLAIIVLGIELISGVLLAYAKMPGLVQTIHLVFASILLGILWYMILCAKYLKPRSNLN
jgi:cytochrome c oxidase assembly protein subunit 15